jgi:hypothetical protein
VTGWLIERRQQMIAVYNARPLISALPEGQLSANDKKDIEEFGRKVAAIRE